MGDLQTALDYADALADWLLELAEASGRRGELEEAARYGHVAASILYEQNRTLSSARLESVLRFVAGCIARPAGQRRVTPPETDRKQVCLHVLTEAMPAGGHTAMATRWIANDRNGRIHCVALLSQQVPVPSALSQAVADAGGSVFTAGQADSFLRKAAWLRNLANEVADYVILHVVPQDVICGMAFGTPGGPPVLLVNHSAHTFWTGVSIADLLVNCRGSALEGVWASTYRGTERYATVPIPLLEPSPPAAGAPPAPEVKRQAKKRLGVPDDATVFLTVGAYFKYLPIDGLDFVKTYEGILQECPSAHLLAVGFSAGARWKAASEGLGSRMTALGTVSQARLAEIHEATDLYVEGFPFGTTTALLEAGLKGIPVVLAPAPCPPPYGSDGVALDAFLERPLTLEEYRATIIRLYRAPAERAALGEVARASIAREHSGAGWRRHLESALRASPREHSVYPATAAARTPREIHEYWSTLVTSWSVRYEEMLEHAIQSSLSLGLRPRVTRELVRISEDFRSVRTGRTVPVPLVAFLCNVLFPVLPTAWARAVFRLFSFFYRGSLLSRIRRRVVRLLGGSDEHRSWYGDYRTKADE